jgi:DNA-binding transcriptional regulator YbjK
MSSTERREQLLDAAVELAAGGDLSALSVRDIAAHAGISEGLLFHYFPTKDALLLAPCSGRPTPCSARWRTSDKRIRCWA